MSYIPCLKKGGSFTNSSAYSVMPSSEYKEISPQLTTAILDKIRNSINFVELETVFMSMSYSNINIQDTQGRLRSSSKMAQQLRGIINVIYATDNPSIRSNVRNVCQYAFPTEFGIREKVKKFINDELKRMLES